MRFTKQIMISLLLMAIVLTTACQGDVIEGNPKGVEEAKTISDTPVEGGQVILPLTNFNTLNPLTTDNSYYYHFSKLIFESLFDFDENLDIVPKLVESYKIDDLGKNIAIKIREDIYWHDGEKLTSQDVAFTLDVIKLADPNTPYVKLFDENLDAFGYSKIRDTINYRVIDDYNIEILYNKEYVNNLGVLTFPIIPRHLFVVNGIPIFRKALEEDYRPVGTGPYKFEAYEKYKNITLKRNEDYWGGEALIEDVIGRVFEDEELILTAYETGQISFAPTIGVDWDKYRQNKRVKVIEYVSSNYEFLGFNFTHPLFSSEEGKLIRQAMNYGIDRQAIIEKAFLGHGTQIDLPIHPNSYLLSQASYSYGYDLVKAKDLLKKAGFIDRDNNGILEDEAGNPLSFRILTNSYNQQRLKVVDLIIEDFKELGIDISKDFDEKYKENLSKDIIDQQWEDITLKLQNGDFDIVLLGWETSLMPNLSLMYHSSKINPKENFIRYENPEVDQLLEKTFYSIGKDTAVKDYHNLQKLIVEELPYVSLFFRNRGLLIDSKIRGELKPSFYNFYKGLENCFIPVDLQ